MPATRASQAASPVVSRTALSSSVASFDSWNTQLARISASVNTCRPPCQALGLCWTVPRAMNASSK